MKREELKVLTDGYAMIYNKDDADAVMDAMEQRIKELSNLCNEKDDELFKEKMRCKELEDELKKEHRVGEDWCAKYWELRASQPKWISVEDRLPKECEAVVCLVDKWEEMSVCWIEYMYEDKRWTDGDRDYPMDYYTHWMPIPQPPKSED